MGSGELPHDNSSAGDPIPDNCRVIEIHVAELKQLFNAIDPSPFREKDLDPKAEEFIVSWARDLPTNATLALLVYLDRPAGMSEEAAILRDAIHEYFSQRGIASRRRLRQLFRLGRTSLFIGITCLAGSLLLGDAIASALHGNRAGEGYGLHCGEPQRNDLHVLPPAGAGKFKGVDFILGRRRGTGRNAGQCDAKRRGST